MKPGGRRTHNVAYGGDGSLTGDLKPGALSSPTQLPSVKGGSGLCHDPKERHTAYQEDIMSPRRKSSYALQFSQNIAVGFCCCCCSFGLFFFFKFLQSFWS